MNLIVKGFCGMIKIFIHLFLRIHCFLYKKKKKKKTTRLWWGTLGPIFGSIKIRNVKLLIFIKALTLILLLRLVYSLSYKLVRFFLQLFIYVVMAMQIVRLDRTLFFTFFKKKVFLTFLLFLLF